MKPGQLIIIAARPSKGKTALACQIALHVALDLAVPVGIFSLEMSKEEIVERMIACKSEVDLGYVGANTPMHDFNKIAAASTAIAGSGIRINERGGMTGMALRASARRMVQRNKVGLVAVDYIQLMTGGVASKENRTQEVSEISRGLKALAKELKVPIIALSQLNRLSETENREPRLSDLRESGSIEQDADVVVMLHAHDGPAGKGEPVSLLVLKNRSGRTGRAETRFEPWITKFRSAATEE
jgi:replicative DNA helicase